MPCSFPCRPLFPLAGSEALAARVAAGPGLWDDEGWLAELRRDGLVGDLLAAGAIGRAAAEGGHAHRLERALTAEMSMLCLVAGSLFPGQGYDMVLARAFAMPGTRVRPGTPVPTGPAFSQGRVRLGEQPMRPAFELDAARDDVPLAEGGTAFGFELVIFDGTTLDLFNCPNWPPSSASRRAGSTRSCGSSRCCRPGRCGGRPPPPTTTTARTLSSTRGGTLEANSDLRVSAVVD